MSENSALHLMEGLKPNPEAETNTAQTQEKIPEEVLADTFRQLSEASVSTRANATFNQIVSLIQQSNYSTFQNVQSLTGLLNPGDNTHLILVLQIFIAMLSDIKASGSAWLSACADKLATKEREGLASEEIFDILLQKLGEQQGNV